jgi:predicted histone-like DNA-binding protein
MKVKAVEKKLKFTKNENDPGIYRYVMQPEQYSSLSQKKVIKEAALRSGVSQGVMQACWDAAGEVIKAWATEGHSVALPGLGTMRFGLRSKSVEKVEDVKSSLITSRRIIFTPDVDLKDELKNTAVQITCYDRDGKEVKRVTSTDDAEVEDPEDTGNENENQNQNSGSGSGSGSGEGSGSGSGSGTGSITTGVAAPTIGGEGAFTTSTQVTMSGPDGAEIRYTTDGSTPTASSTLYTEPLTVSSSVTLKAIAIKDGQSSEVATKQFVKNTSGGDDPSGFEGA